MVKHHEVIVSIAQRKGKTFFLSLLLLLSLFTKFSQAELPLPLPIKKTNESDLHYTLQGIKGNIRKNIDTRLSVLIKDDKGYISQSRYRQFMQEAPEQILKAMQPFGYYKPSIRSTLIGAGSPHALVIFTITKGPRMKVSSLNLILEGDGKNEPFFQDIINHFPLKPGDPLLVKQYNEGKQRFLDTATQQGYLKAQMTESQIRIDLEHYTADIIIRFNTGSRYYFGPVSFSKTPFDEDYLRRYLTFERGEPFTPDSLTQLQDALSNSDQFKQISVVPEYEKIQGQEVPVLVTLSPQPSQNYTFGAGYGTDTGVRGTIGWNLLQLTPSGHKFQALVQASQLQNSAQAQYIIPGKHPATEEYAIIGSVYNLDYPSSKSNAAQLSAVYRKHKGNLQQNYAMNLLYEHYTIDDLPSQNAFIPYPSANWKILEADNPIFAKNGYSLTFNAQGSSKALASTANFAQGEIQAKWVKTLKATRTRLYTRADLGYTAISDINDLPPSLQFYAGGSQSVRGYTYQSLGPGKILMTGSVEWQQEVIKNGYITFFYDAGNAFNDTPIDLMRSVGGGIMWVTPIGPLRLSLAKALDQEDGNPWHVVFSMGPDL